MSHQRRATTVPLPTPLAVRPSGKWDGNDGSWSTFIINIGDDDASGDGQNFRVIPSISSGVTLVPQQVGWCQEDCPGLRGVETFNGRSSLGFDSNVGDWVDAGLYNIPMPYWFSSNLTKDPSGNPGGIFGVSSIGLGESSGLSTVVTDQYVVKYQAEDFYLGWLGLTVGTNSAGQGSRSNFLDSLYGTGNNTIMSRSFGYSAGAHYSKQNKFELDFYLEAYFHVWYG